MNRSKQDKAKEDLNENAMAVSTLLPHLPDLVMHQIILLLPTKPAIRMSCLSKQWEGVWSALRILDFDEGNQPHDDDDDDDVDNYKHAKFINILVRYLEFRKKDKQPPLLDKFRLCMRYLNADEDAIIGKLLSNSFERNVKELDISLVSKQQEVECYYCLPRMALVNAKSVTTLNLECLRIKDIDSAEPEPIFPSLKTLSLKTVHFDGEALFYLILGCPSVEYLSLTSCSFEPPVLHVSSSSLKSLEVKNCNAQHIEVDKAMNLESFTCVSKFSLFRSMVLSKSIKLSYVKIRAQYLNYLGVLGCHDSLKATINTPNLVHFVFRGYIKSRVSISVSDLLMTHLILEDKEFSTFNGPWKHFATLRDFLKSFGYSKIITLSIRDFKALIFPENFQRAFYPPLPGLKHLVLSTVNLPTEETESADLKESLAWMSHSTVEFVQIGL